MQLKKFMYKENKQKMRQTILETKMEINANTLNNYGQKIEKKSQNQKQM